MDDAFVSPPCVRVRLCCPCCLWSLHEAGYYTPEREYEDLLPLATDPFPYRSEESLNIRSGNEISCLKPSPWTEVPQMRGARMDSFQATAAEMDRRKPCSNRRFSAGVQKHRTSLCLLLAVAKNKVAFLKGFLREFVS